jgi:lysosomal-associated membrane protein 1/2
MKFTGFMVLVVVCGLLSVSAEKPEARERDREWRDEDDGQRRRESDRDDREWERRTEERSGKNLRDAEPPEDPVVGFWNVTDGRGEICIRLDGSIKMEINYEMLNGTMGKTTLVSTPATSVDQHGSRCGFNSSSSVNQTLALDFGIDRRLYFEFTRDKTITGDKNENKWQLFEIRFNFVYDDDFPAAKEARRERTERNVQPLNEIIVSSKDKSYGCTTSDPIKVDDRFYITLNSFRTQAFMTSNDFGQAEWCAKEQTSDLIPIIIGAALAALVIIVLIAYLIGRARARTTNYDNI